MWLQRLQVTAFGALRDQSIELSPGLNIVHGPNESAKSTWHAALTVGLCGRRRGGGRRSDEVRFEARHRPWDHAEQWALTLGLVLDDGRTIEIDRDLVQQRSSVVDVGLGGRAVDDDIIRDGSPDGAVWLGLDRSSYRATASVRQTELLAVLDQADGLGEHLARAAAGGTGVTAAAALERLSRFQKERVGVEKVTAVRPLRRAMNAVASAEDDLAATVARHAEYQRLVRAAVAARGRVAAARQAMSAAEAAIAVTRRDRLADQLSRLEALAAEFPEGGPAAGVEAPTGEVQAWLAPLRAAAPSPIRDVEARLEAARLAELEHEAASMRRRRIGFVGWAALLGGAMTAGVGGGVVRVGGLVVAVAAALELAIVLRGHGSAPVAESARLEAELDQLRHSHDLHRRAGEEALRMLRRHHERWGRFQAALDGQTLEDHQERVRQAATEAEKAIESAAGEISGADDPRAALRAAAELLASAREDADLAAGGLAQIDSVGVDVGAAEARLGVASEELGGIRRLQQTLETTRSFLERAHEQAHRVLAPRLEAEMTRWVPTVTQGRYVGAQVDPETLAVRLRGADGKVRDAAMVSHGTAEQVHLVLRMVLSRLLTDGIERCPVLLDDPTVHADPDRKVDMLDYLQEVSRSHQVVVFSQEAHVARWAAEHLDPDIDSLVWLSGPDGPNDPVLGADRQWNLLRSVR